MRCCCRDCIFLVSMTAEKEQSDFHGMGAMGWRRGGSKVMRVRVRKWRGTGGFRVGWVSWCKVEWGNETFV